MAHRSGREGSTVPSVRDAEPHFYPRVLMSAHIDITADLNKVCCFFPSGTLMLEIFWVEEMSVIGQTAWIWIRQLCTSYVNLSAGLGIFNSRGFTRSCCHKHTLSSAWPPSESNICWSGRFDLPYATWMRPCLRSSSGVQLSFGNMLGKQFPVTEDIIMGGIMFGPEAQDTVDGMYTSMDTCTVRKTCQMTLLVQVVFSLWP